MLIPGMQPGLDLRHIGQKISLILIVHMIIPITLEMLHRLSTHCQIKLLRTVPLFTTHIRMRITHLSLFLVLTNILTLWQVPNPL